MPWQIFSAPWNEDQASALAGWFWLVLMIVWAVMRFTIKPAKKRETLWEITQHAIPAILGFWLLFEKYWKLGPLSQRILPNVPLTWDAGLLLTAFGIAVAIWARLALGTNWSG